MMPWMASRNAADPIGRPFVEEEKCGRGGTGQRIMHTFGDTTQEKCVETRIGQSNYCQLQSKMCIFCKK
jgi:hypothetical protein